MIVERVADIESMRLVSELLAAVWGRNHEGVPMPSEVLLSIAHAGGMVSTARLPGSDDLLGAAVLGRDVPGAAYSYIAAAQPGHTGRGIGHLLKLHQRDWALDQGIDLIRWTYDPLVARNARFNLIKLGALARVYERAFYGVMTDDINGADVADRLVAEWHLASPRAVRAAAGEFDEVGGPPQGLEPAAMGPDGLPALVYDGDNRWLRVPADVVALRRQAPELASAWRDCTRAWFTEAFAEGAAATAMTRDGWYQLTPLPEGVPAGPRAGTPEGTATAWSSDHCR